MKNCRARPGLPKKIAYLANLADSLWRRGSVEKKISGWGRGWDGFFRKWADQAQISLALWKAARQQASCKGPASAEPEPALSAEFVPRAGFESLPPSATEIYFSIADLRRASGLVGASRLNKLFHRASFARKLCWKCARKTYRSWHDVFRNLGLFPLLKRAPEQAGEVLPDSLLNSSQPGSGI